MHLNLDHAKTQTSQRVGNALSKVVGNRIGDAVYGSHGRARALSPGYGVQQSVEKSIYLLVR